MLETYVPWPVVYRYEGEKTIIKHIQEEEYRLLFFVFSPENSNVVIKSDKSVFYRDGTTTFEFYTDHKSAFISGRKNFKNFSIGIIYNQERVDDYYNRGWKFYEIYRSDRFDIEVSEYTTEEEIDKQFLNHVYRMLKYNYLKKYVA